eukprot:5327617-Pyramimonas_sp.AAC.1
MGIGRCLLFEGFSGRLWGPLGRLEASVGVWDRSFQRLVALLDRPEGLFAPSWPVLRPSVTRD